MPVIISDYDEITGTATPTQLNVPVTVIEITGSSGPYIVEGYIDVSSLLEGETVEIVESVAVDGNNYRTFIKTRISGIVDEPAIRFHSKTLLSSMKYKVTISQIAGTLRSFPFAFIRETLRVM